jgi:hypothetical protein
LTCPGQRISMLTCLLSRSMQLRERAWAAPGQRLGQRLGSAPIRAVLEHQPTSTWPGRSAFAGGAIGALMIDEAHWLLKCRALLHISEEEVHHLIEKPPFS